MKLTTLTILGGILIFSSSCSDPKIKELEEKYKCNSFEDCLDKYEFEGAHAFGSHLNMSSEDELRLVNAESEYWVKEKEYSKAISLIDEFSTAGTRVHMEGDLLEIKLKTFNKIIDNLIEERNFDKAKEFALKLSNTENNDGDSEEYFMDLSSDEDRKFMSQQKVMLDKIETAEKLLKKSE
jgi:hypothetical protein